MLKTLCERICVVTHLCIMSVLRVCVCGSAQGSPALICGSLRGQRGQLWRAGGLGVRKLNMKCKQTLAWTFSSFTF